MKTCLSCNGIIMRNLNFSNIFKNDFELLCETCLNRLEQVKNGCARCCKKGSEVICEDCRYWEAYELTKMFQITNYSMYYYNDFGKSMIEKIKFSGDLKCLLAFRNQILEYFKEKKWSDIYLVPVPLHEERLKERGFNQSLALANLIPFPILDVVVKLNNEKQSKKKRIDRLCFDAQYALKENAELLNKKIMIVDDIYTTGATIHKIGKLFADKHIKEIMSFTLFRG